MRSTYLGKMALLVALYVLTGKFGKLLTVPPDYATVIWPASGIAIGMLIVHGARLAPGVFIGSALLNAWNSGWFTGAEISSTRLAIAAGVALGSTAQALVGRFLVSRFVGIPLRLSAIRELLVLLVVAGPFTCVVAATIGVTVLSALGLVGSEELVRNWFAWWSGDTLGVLVFMPLVLLAPGSDSELTWRGTRMGRLTLAGTLLLLLPLGLTFYAWKATKDNDYQRGQAQFQTLTVESEKALQSRISSYGNALLGAAGFIQGSTDVSRAEWRAYVDTIQVRENFPGINGLGWIVPVPSGRRTEFERAMQADDAPEFEVHPRSSFGPDYIITFLEPEALNRAAIGLNIAFDKQRLAAAERARDTGAPAITARIGLVQDEQASPGFLLLYPIYHRDLPVATPDARRAAFRGWTFAPVIARHFLDDLTPGQSSEYRLRIYDGEAEDPDELMFTSEAGVTDRPMYTQRAVIDIMQRHWLMVWESAPPFENAARSTNPLFILIGGVLFTALLALLLIVIAARRPEQLERMVGERRFAVPALVFVVLAVGSFALYTKLREREFTFALRQVQDEGSKIATLLRTQASDRVASLARMGARWEAAGGTEYRQWQRDAANHIAAFAGLRSIEWIDSTYHIRWLEPLEGNESALGMNLLFEPSRADALRGAATRQRPTLSPPIQLIQGYPAIIVYMPLHKNGEFDGFLAGLFSIEDFLRGAIGPELSGDYTVTLVYGGRSYATASAGEAPPAEWITETSVRMQDESWTLRVAPTRAFVASQESGLPLLALVGGLLVAALAALSVRFILVSRLKSVHLAESLALNAGIISSSAHLVIAIDEEFRIMIFNKAAETALGYSAADVIGRRAVPIFMDAKELEERARVLSAELGETVPMGPEIFTRIPLRDGFETHEWTFVRRDGSRFPVSATITPLREPDGEVYGFLGVVEDVTARREVDRMKSEFMAVVSHELRTPLTSIRGSLGLILGALSQSLQPKVQNLLEIAQSNCERLVLLVNDILDIEKFAFGQMRFDFQTVALPELLRQAVEANEGYARKFHVRIDSGGARADCEVRVDPDRFIQVMSNLLSNAAKYSPDGGTVRVTSAFTGDAVRIAVADEGPGIPDEFRARIFEKFSQADASATRAKGGTGLGLHIARRFVEAMGGRIGFDSIPGTGTTFWIELPLATRPLATGTTA